MYESGLQRRGKTGNLDGDFPPRKSTGNLPEDFFFFFLRREIFVSKIKGCTRFPRSFDFRQVGKLGNGIRLLLVV